uniref:Uncharacterized protein n=1 Tax=Anguilla anguilla TaxID=7936 RepID=A0A0E9X6H1_ANGAN
MCLLLNTQQVGPRQHLCTGQGTCCEHTPAGLGAGRLPVPWPRCGLLSGSCAHSAWPLGHWPGANGLCSWRSEDKGGEHRPPLPVSSHLRRPLLLQLQRRGHLQGRGHAVELVNDGLAGPQSRLGRGHAPSRSS